MRIRKNLKISHQAWKSSNPPLQAYICQLNQSPWDVDVSPSTNSSPLFQLQEHDSFLGNGPCEDITGHLESFAKICGENGSSVEEEDQEKKLEDVIINYCSKRDENGNWICGLEAKDGETLCEFHLRSYVALASHVVRQVTKNNMAKKSKIQGNPYQSFSYYSGFGPNWGKNRATRGLNKTNGVVASPSLTDNLSEFEDEDDDDDDNFLENGTKRVRKRIKARSLKSLM